MTFVITTAYGPQGNSLKLQFIEELLCLNPGPDTPWILGGDFNLVRWITDRSSLNPDWQLIDSFNDLIRQLQLFDVPLEGRKFTWSNKHPAPNFSKIDRFLLSTSFLSTFLSISLTPGPLVASDHIPLILTCTQQSPHRPVNRLKKFWLHYADFNLITEEVFSQQPDNPDSNPILTFSGKLTTLHMKLRTWHISKFAKSSTYLETCKSLIGFFDRLEELRPLVPLELFVRIKIREEAYELANNEEIRWHQRARCRWLAHGDRNTRYFHLLASSKFRRNRISTLKHQGADVTDSGQIANGFHSYYKDLLGTSDSRQWLDATAVCNSPLDLQYLAAPFFPSEVHQAI